MNKNRIIILVIAIVAVALLFTLPRVVVENTSEPREMNETATTADPQQEKPTHTPNLSATQRAKIEALKKKIEDSVDSEKSIIFADSLAELYSSANKFDSAAYYMAKAGSEAEKVGLQYYEAFTYAVNAEKAAELGAEARKYFEQVLKEDPGRLDIKSKMALTYISTENPMQGIGILREILEEDPQNEDAIFNLGVLAIQSRQYDRALDRFKTLVEINAQNEQAQFYLGFSYYQLGQDEKARAVFEKLMNSSDDKELKGTVEGYLKELN